MLFSPSGRASLGPEQLTYKVTYLWLLPLGKVTIASEPYMLDKQDIYQISSQYHPPKWLAFFDAIKGKINSYVDTEKILPLRYEEFYSYPFHDDVNTVLIYDQDKRRVYIDRNGEKETKDIFQLTLDPLSALYFLRYRHWKFSGERSFNLNNHQTNYELVVRSEGIVRIKGEPMWHVSGFVKRYNQIKKLSDTAFEVWLTDDEKRLPVKIVLSTKFGRLQFRLQRRLQQ